MLLLHSRTGEICRAPVDLGGNALPPDLVWIDLLKPSPEEVAFVERATGLELPNFEALSEIESSSRLRAVNGALFLSAPLVYRSDADDPQATPVGFILTPEHFITVRFETPTAFTTAAQTPSPTSPSLTANSRCTTSLKHELEEKSLASKRYFAGSTRIAGLFHLQRSYLLPRRAVSLSRLVSGYYARHVARRHPGHSSYKSP